MIKCQKIQAKLTSKSTHHIQPLAGSFNPKRSRPQSINDGDGLREVVSVAETATQIMSKFRILLVVAGFLVGLGFGHVLTKDDASEVLNSIPVSVTIFDEIWQKFTSIWQIFDSLFLFWQNAEPTLTNLRHYWANYHFC